MPARVSPAVDPRPPTPTPGQAPAPAQHRFPPAQRPRRAPSRSRCPQARQAHGGGAGAGQALRADGAPARVLLCVLPLFFHLFLKNSFIEIRFTHHRARPCEACGSVGFILSQVASSHHHTDCERSYPLRREPRRPLAVALRAPPPPASSSRCSALCAWSCPCRDSHASGGVCVVCDWLRPPSAVFSLSRFAAPGRVRS